MLDREKFRISNSIVRKIFESREKSWNVARRFVREILFLIYIWVTSSLIRLIPPPFRISSSFILFNFHTNGGKKGKIFQRIHQRFINQFFKKIENITLIKRYFENIIVLKEAITLVVIKRSITFSWKREFTWNCLKSCRILFADNSSTVKLKTCTHRSNELLQLFLFNRLATTYGYRYSCDNLIQ